MKTMMIFAAVALLSAPAFAGERPEFDAVGCDSSNYFNDKVDQIVIDNNLDGGLVINDFSAFPAVPDIDCENHDYDGEYFTQTAGQPKADPCFPDYMSSLVDAWNSAEFTWQMVLQMKPDTDLDISIRDCVLKANSRTPFGENPFEGAMQTGRYMMPWGQVFWLQNSNPRITVTAYPGEYATAGFPDCGFTLTGRTTPGLAPVLLQDQLYTSKGVWEESVVVIMPETGVINAAGQTEYRLKQGDMINVAVEVPGTNTVDMYYGADNVKVKYVGITGTEYIGMPCN